MIYFKINGKDASIEAQPDTPLLWVLRDHLQLTGTKYGCGMAQCGYCQSGQIMSATALLKEHPHPSEAQISAAMDGNLCRCGTYNRIRAAIHKAAELQGGAK
jgi:aerobic-type carbon monoxide dehydrogenase small subunit (CoxS/CutS family)